MKGHILAALREQFNSWQELLASLSEEQITAPHFDLDWSIKDMIAHDTATPVSAPALRWDSFTRLRDYQTI